MGEDLWEAERSLEFGTCGLESPELRRLRTCRGPEGVTAEVKMFQKTAGNGEGLWSLVARIAP